MKRILERFQATRLVSDDYVFNPMLASSPAVNAGVRPEQSIKDLKVIDIQIFKGLLDLFSDTPFAREILGPQEAARIAAMGEDVLAAVLAHEMGHIVNGDLDRLHEQTTRVHWERGADEFGVRLLAEAGYRPRAMVDLFECLGVLRQARDTPRGQLFAILADHPKPKFRIAGVIELVRTLETTEAARKEFKLSDRTGLVRQRKPRPLDRNGQERTSRTAVERFSAHLDAQTYLERPLEEKLKFLERYFVTARGDDASPEAIVRGLRAYQDLISESVGWHDLDAITESVRNFYRGTARPLANHDTKLDRQNVRKALASLRNRLTTVRLDILKQQHPEGLCAANLAAWAPNIDKSVVVGVLNAEIAQAKDVNAVIRIIRAFDICAPQLRPLFPDASAEEAAEASLFAGAIRRGLHLTNNLDEGLNLVQELCRIDRDRNYGFTMKFAPEIFAEFIFYALMNEDVEFGDFNQRMSAPRTAEDRALAIVMNSRETQLKTFAHYQTKRGKTVNLDLLKGRAAYGAGHADVAHGKITSDHVRLLSRLLSSLEEVNAVLSELFERRCSMGHAIDMVARAAPERANTWNALRPQLLAHHDARRGDDFVSQLHRVAESLLTQRVVDDPELLARLRKDIAEAARRSDELHFDHIQALCKTILSLESAPNADKKARADNLHRPDPIPRLSVAQAADIPYAHRLGFFDGVARLDEERRARRLGGAFIAVRGELKEILDRMAKEDDIETGVVDEFMSAYDALATDLEGFLSGRSETLPESYFRSRRQLWLMWRVLENGSAIEKNITARVRDAIWPAIFAMQRTTAAWEVRTPFYALVANSFTNVERYLTDPTPENLSKLSIGLAGDLAQRIAYYEGLGRIDSAADLFGFTSPAFAARTVLHRAQAQRGNSTPFLDLVPMASAQESTLVTLGPAFQRVLAKHMSRKRSRTLPELVHNDLIEHAWPLVAHRALTDPDPIRALAYSLWVIGRSDATEEVVTQFHYTMLMRALEQVKTKDEMETYCGMLAMFLRSSKFSKFDLESLAKASPEDLVRLNQLRYREGFYNRLATRLNEFDAWSQHRRMGESIGPRFMTKVGNSLFASAERYGSLRPADSPGCPPLYRIKLLRDLVFGPLLDKPWVVDGVRDLKRKGAELYTRALIAQGFDTGDSTTKETFEALQGSTLSSAEVDRAIAEHVRAGQFEGLHLLPAQTRRIAVELTGQIKSPDLRAKVYADVLKQHGPLRVGPLQRIQDNIALYRAYRKAEEIWTREVLEQLKGAQSDLERLKITEAAWEEHAARRATKRGMDKMTAYRLLRDPLAHKGLYEALLQVECPGAREVQGLFREGTRHRDAFLEAQLKAGSHDVEGLLRFEAFKSYRTETPYHKLMKATLELSDEAVSRLPAETQADVVLFLSGVNPAVSASTNEDLKGRVRSSRNRTRALGKIGGRAGLTDVKRLIGEAHPEERFVAFQTMLSNGIMGNADAEKVLTDQLLLADPDMPDYLRGLLKVYLRVANREERTMNLSWILANCEGRPPKGPEVLERLVEQGGVVAAKIAQVVASHGFRLPPDYREVLEHFKGNAQKIDKLVFVRWAKARLSPEHFDQIKSFDRELGSGSYKIAYLCTLKDGRRVVIKQPREYVIQRTAREFELINRLMEAVMNDPALRLDNLPAVREEVKRIIREELKLENELRFMKDHQKAYELRPPLVRMLGNRVRVEIPQPLEAWSSEEVLVDEYVKSLSWGDLPATSVTGWSKERLAKAAVTESLTQLISFIDPTHLVDQKVIIDIDPHEENQLAKSGLLRFFAAMVNIDLGQSVSVPPEQVRGLVQMVGLVLVGDVDAAVQIARDYMDFPSEDAVELFRSALKNRVEQTPARPIRDPFEIMTKAFEDVELKGVSLKPEHLFFQKLFATMIGMKRHIRDPNFVTTQAIKVLGLYAVSSPSAAVHEARLAWHVRKAS